MLIVARVPFVDLLSLPRIAVNLHVTAYDGLPVCRDRYRRIAVIRCGWSTRMPVNGVISELF